MNQIEYLSQVMQEKGYTPLYTLSQQLKSVDLASLNADAATLKLIEQAIAKIQGMASAEAPKLANLNKNLVFENFKHHLEHQGIKKGRIAELGGPGISFSHLLPDFEFTYLSLYPMKDDDRVVVANITECDYIEDESFDAVFSSSVFEHVSKPWLAGKNITRILKPGGISFQYAPFSYFYHGSPEDYWRYTPDAFEVIFSELETLEKSFQCPRRRLDNWGTEFNAVDKSGGEIFAPDGFGGWRENWFATYVGKKNPDYLKQKTEKAEKQLLVDIVKGLTLTGLNDDQAIEQTLKILPTIKVNHDNEISWVEPGQGLAWSKKELKKLWKTRSRETVLPGYRQFSAPQLLGLV